MSMDPLSKTPVATGLDEVFPVVTEAQLLTSPNMVEVAPKKVPEPPPYLAAVTELNYADNPVIAVDFNKVTRRALPKLGRGEDSVLARGTMMTHGIPVEQGDIGNALKLFRMQTGQKLGDLQTAYERLEGALADAGNLKGREGDKARYKALVEFGEAAKGFLVLNGVMGDASLVPDFESKLNGLIDQVAAEAARMNNEGRFSKEALTKQGLSAKETARKTHEVLDTVNAAPLSQQLKAGMKSDAVREILSENGYFQRHDSGKLCDNTGKELTDAEVDALGDQVVNWAAAKLVEAEEKLLAAEKKLVNGLNEDERGVYEQVRQDFERMKLGQPPRNEREAVSQAYIKTHAEFPDDTSVDEAFVDRLMSPEGITDTTSLTPAQQAFIANLGDYGKPVGGVVRLDKDAAVRQFFGKVVKTFTQPSSPAAATLMKTFIDTVKVFNDVVKVARSLGKDPYKPIAQAFRLDLGGMVLGSGRAVAKALRRARAKIKQRATGKQEAVVKKKPALAGAGPATVTTPVGGTRTMPLTVTPEAMTSAKLKAGKQWSDLIDTTGGDDLKDTNRRMIKARLSAILADTVGKQKAYDASVKHEGDKAHAEKAAK